LESKAAAPLVLVLLIGGCAKRQAVPRVVYVQPPPATSADAAPKQTGGAGTFTKAADAPDQPNQADKAAGSMEALVIEEPPLPAPPEPVTAPAPPAVSPPVPSPKRRPHPRTDSHDADEQTEPTDSAVPASLSEAPSLEPQSDAGQSEALQNQLQSQNGEIKRRIDELDKNADLNATERRTLKDAKSFWSQSVAALQDRDLLRARELAQKASLLLTALEKR
jgi:hypothetical protein